jgi:hypothetical protein
MGIANSFGTLASILIIYFRYLFSFNVSFILLILKVLKKISFKNLAHELSVLFLCASLALFIGLVAVLILTKSELESWAVTVNKEFSSLLYIADAISQ